MDCNAQPLRPFVTGPPMALALLAILALIAMATGCGGEGSSPSEPAPGEDDGIPAETRNAIQALNRQLLDSLTAGDPSVIEGMFADEVREGMASSGGARAAFDQMRQLLEGADVQPYRDFYTTFADGSSQSASLRAPGEGMAVVVQPIGSEVYVSLLEAPGAFRDQLLGLIWARDDGSDWRLYAFRLGALRMLGRTARDWYTEAVTLRDQSLLLPASMRLLVAVDLLRPVPFVRFDDEEEIRGTQQAVQAQLEAAYTFPIELTTLDSSPKVFRIEPQFVQRQLAPIVSYVSTLELREDVLQDEVNSMTRQLSAQIPGFCHELRHIPFRAHGTMPPPGTQSAEAVTVVGDCS